MRDLKIHLLSSQNDIRFITEDEIYLLHGLLMEKQGSTLIDEYSKDSVGSILHSLYICKEYMGMNIIELAAILCVKLSSAHLFYDGNKRIALMAMLYFLKINKITLKKETEDDYEVFLNIAASSHDEETVDTLCENLEKWIIDKIY